MFDEKSFSLLKSVLMDAYQLRICYFPDWKESIAGVDSGLRLSVIDSEIQYDIFRQMLLPLQPCEIISLKDTLLLRYILIRGMEKRDFYAIGPFRSQPFSQKDFAWLKEHNQLSTSETEMIRTILAYVPTNLNRMITMAIARNLLRSFYGMTAPGVREIDLSVQPEKLPTVIPAEDFNTRAKRIEEIYKHEAKLCGFIAEGNYQRAMQEARFFSQSGLDRNLPNLALSNRSYFYAANTVFRKAAQSVNIHPLYLDEISQTFARRIALCTSTSQLIDTYMEMVSQYCKLCRDRSMEKYGQNAKKIINYILLHLNSDLSANVVGLATGFSASYVSRIIRSETGISLTQFVTNERIRVAKRLLEESPDSISGISMYVGIPDWNYFTKLFKKVEGCTPSEYRKRNQKIPQQSK